MAVCGSCSGAGKVSCSACGGTGNTSRFTSLGGGGVEINTCAVCYGSGRMQCNFCGGRGQVDFGGESASAQTPEELYHMGIALWSGSGYSDPNLAIDYFTQAIRLDPNNANTYHARGMAYDQLGRYAEAVADLSCAVSLYPDNAEYYNNRGNAYYAMNKLAEARRDWEKACDMGSTHGCENLERFFSLKK